MIKPNVGTWDAYMRIMGGLMALAYGIRRSIRRNDGLSTLFIMAGSMKVAEGVTRVCPLMHAMGIATTEHPIGAEEIPQNSRRSVYSAHENEAEEVPLYS